MCNRLTARWICTYLVPMVMAVPAWALLPEFENEQGVPTLSVLLRKIKPAVVNISVPSQDAAGTSPLQDDPFFKRFLEPSEDAPTPPYIGVGSGVIVNAKQGHLLTNHHVIEGVEDILVTLDDQRRLRAELIGSDPETDIALLKIVADNLVALPFGDSDRLEVGDFVIAVGNPFGLGQTVTSGIVSGLGRSGLGIEGFEDFIQTDASINPGNSGGALVNLQGDLIGINTAILAPEGGNVGISFAIPSNMAFSVMQQILQYGEVRRGRIGVALQDLTPELAQALNVAAIGGAVLTQVIKDSPAGQAGLRLGDVVVEMNGRKVRGSADLRIQIGLIRIGNPVELKYLRENEIKTVTIQVIEESELPAKAGNSIAGLDGALLENTQSCTAIFGDLAGVLVMEVEPDSSAGRYGLRQGDIIVGVNRKSLSSMAELADALKIATPPVALNVVRDGSGLYIVIEAWD